MSSNPCCCGEKSTTTCSRCVDGTCCTMLLLTANNTADENTNNNTNSTTNNTSHSCGARLRMTCCQNATPTGSSTPVWLFMLFVCVTVIHHLPCAFVMNTIQTPTHTYIHTHTYFQKHCWKPIHLHNPPTGQGMNRVQQANNVSRAIHSIIHTCQQRLGHWVGSSVVHLGDHNVPNALMFIDKYTQVC